METVFDKLAEDYDSTFTHSFIGKAQREIVRNYLDNILKDKKKLNVLELNCGTGEDAIHFARMGYTVHATDQSIGMLEIANKKIEKEGLSNKIKTSVLDITKIGGFNSTVNFDLIFSNFGGMNCISTKEICTLPASLSKLLKSSGRLIMIIMPNSCAWEIIYFMLKLKFKKAFRRYSAKEVLVKMNGREMKTYYHSPLIITKIFDKYFNKVITKPVGFFIPPSYLEKFFASKIKTFNLLKKFELLISNWSFLSSNSDHYLIDLQVK
jgi:ubiquinone/menaquinone biosynthesis C-methylase UbiE